MCVRSRALFLSHMYVLIYHLKEISADLIIQDEGSKQKFSYDLEKN